MSKDRDNVIPLRRVARDPDAHLEGSFLACDDVRELVSLMSDNCGSMSLVFTPVAEGYCAHEIQDADDVDRLAVYLVRLAQRMRQGGSPP